MYAPSDRAPPRRSCSTRAGSVGRTFRLDPACPDALLAVEYDGREHLTPERARRDLVREALPTSAGRYIVRFDAQTVLYHPERVVTGVRPEPACDRR